MIDRILSYREMCDEENVQTLQRGMNFRLNPKYSVVLMSRRSNAPYKDRILDDGITLEYEGHDEPKTATTMHPKDLDQPRKTKNKTLTQNGYFAKEVEEYQLRNTNPETVKVYEKILPGVWSLKGFFKLIDYRLQNDGKRNVFIFKLQLAEKQDSTDLTPIDLQQTRLIPSEIKQEVWARDNGKCVICGNNNNLHFDHELPFSRGGTSLSAKNIRLLCMKHNLQKSDKIE